MPSLTFNVDYDHRIDEVLDHAGFGWRAPARLGVFGSGRHQLSAARITFDADVATPTAIARMTAEKLRPATFYELASAADADAALGRDAVVVALGSCDVNYAGGAASPAIATFEGERQIVMTGFLGAWPAGTEFFAIPADLAAGHGNVAHNHLLPIEAKRSPKLVFTQPPCTLTHGVPYDGALALRDAIKAAKLRNVSDLVYKDDQFPPDAEPVHAMLEVLVLSLNRQVRSVEAIAELAARGYRPAKVRELVALVAAVPDLIETRAIWALGDATCAGAYKAGTRTLGVHVGRDNGSDPVFAGQRWEPPTSFAGVRRIEGGTMPAAPTTAKAPADKKTTAKKAPTPKSKPRRGD